jgi:Putative Actinobacterial Holin-X, holin superfamily III
MAEERTLGQLVAQASDDLSGIVRAEVALAKAELRTDAKNAAVGGGLFGAAGYLGVLATVALVIAAAYGLVAAGLAPWLAFLIVAVVLLLLAGILALVGRSRMRKLGPPERTIRSAKDTIAAVKPGNTAKPGNHER